MCNGLLRPGGVLFQVIATAFLLDVDETRHPVVLQNLVAILKQRKGQLVVMTMAQSLRRVFEDEFQVGIAIA